MRSLRTSLFGCLLLAMGCNSPIEGIDLGIADFAKNDSKPADMTGSTPDLTGADLKGTGDGGGMGDMRDMTVAVDSAGVDATSNVDAAGTDATVSGDAAGADATLSGDAATGGDLAGTDAAGGDASMMSFDMANGTCTANAFLMCSGTNALYCNAAGNATDTFDCNASGGIGGCMGNTGCGQCTAAACTGGMLTGCDTAHEKQTGTTACVTLKAGGAVSTCKDATTCKQCDPGMNGAVCGDGSNGLSTSNSYACNAGVIGTETVCAFGCDGMTGLCRDMVPASAAATHLNTSGTPDTFTCTGTQSALLPDVTAAAGETLTFNTTNSTIANSNGSSFTGRWGTAYTVPGSNTNAIVSHIQSLNVAAGATVVVTGTRALILLVDKGVTIAGAMGTPTIVQLNATLATAGPGANTLTLGAAGTNATTGGHAGGGAGHGTAGGTGGTVNNAAGATAAGTAYGSAVVLEAGAVGGSGSGGTVAAGGGGGGALQVSACGAVSISSFVVVNASGGGGAAGAPGLVGLTTGGGGGAGGSGGTLLLEASSFTVLGGSLVANGGGGGSGGNGTTAGGVGSDWSTAAAITTPAAGASTTGGAGGAGGAGSTAPVNGANGMGNFVAGGGGGGAVGRIFVNVSPIANNAAPQAASPAAQLSKTCVTSNGAAPGTCVYP